MNHPVVCPVCQAEKIEPVLRKTLLSAEFNGEVEQVSGVLAYRCANGHMFLVVPSEPKARRKSA